MNFRPKKRRFPFRFSVHPLFLLMGIWYSFTKQLPLFLLSALIALQHECAHAFAAARLGYKLDRIVLMPYGAVIDGDLEGISLKDEAFVAICGPLTNLATGMFFVALWWLFPNLYAYTDTACYASVFIGLLNFLPSYPLDGGRILMSVLQRYFLKKHPPRVASKKARAYCLVLSTSIVLCLLFAFVFLCFQGRWNFTLLAFALFLGVGGFGHAKNKVTYQKLDYSFKGAFRRGVTVRHVAVDTHCTVKKALRFLDERSYVAFEIYDDNEQFLGTLSQNELAKRFATTSLYERLSSLLNQPSAT